MRMTVPVAQMRIVRDLREAEVALDEALLKQASLLSTMVTARRETGSEPFLGQEALMRLTKSQQTLLSAGGELARVHGQLLDVQRETGVGEECPEDEKANSSGQRVA